MGAGRVLELTLGSFQAMELQEDSSRAMALEKLAEFLLILRDRGLVPNVIRLSFDGKKIAEIPGTMVEALEQCPDWLVDELSDSGMVKTMTRAWLWILSPNRTPTGEDLWRWYRG